MSSTGIPENPLRRFSSAVSLAAGDITESIKTMFSALTKVLQKALTSMGTQLREHSKCQREQVNKLTEALTQLTYLHNGNKLAARSTADLEKSDNSDSGEGDEENDRRNMVTLCEMDYNLYNEIDQEASFPSHQETSLSSVTTTGKPEDNPMMGSVFKEFSESYKHANKNWRKLAFQDLTKVASVAFKDTPSENALKYLLTKVTQSENCISAPAKFVSPVIFTSVSPSI